MSSFIANTTTIKNNIDTLKKRQAYYSSKVKTFSDLSNFGAASNVTVKLYLAKLRKSYQALSDNLEHLIAFLEDYVSDIEAVEYKASNMEGYSCVAQEVKHTVESIRNSMKNLQIENDPIFDIVNVNVESSNANVNSFNASNDSTSKNSSSFSSYFADSAEKKSFGSIMKSALVFGLMGMTTQSQKQDYLSKMVSSAIAGNKERRTSIATSAFAKYSSYQSWRSDMSNSMITFTKETYKKAAAKVKETMSPVTNYINEKASVPELIIEDDTYIQTYQAYLAPIDAELKSIGDTQKLIENEYAKYAKIEKYREQIAKFEKYGLMSSWEAEAALSTKLPKKFQEIILRDFDSLEDYENYIGQLKDLLSSCEMATIQANNLKEVGKYECLSVLEDFQNFQYNAKVNTKDLNIISDNGVIQYSSYEEYCKKNGNVSELAYAEALGKAVENLRNSGSSDGIEISVHTQQLINLAKVSNNDSDYAKYYNYLYKTYGVDAANEYLSVMEPTVNNILGREQAEKILSHLSTTEGVTSAVKNHINTTEMGLGSGVSSFVSGIEYALSGVKAFFTNESPTRANSVEEYANMYVQEALQSGEYTGKYLKDNYVVSQGIGNMAPSIALSSLGVPIAGSIALGVSSGGNSYHSAMVDGYSNVQAISYGIVSGFTEALTEKYLGGLPGLSDVEVTNFKTFIKAMIKEGNEEAVQEAFDSVVRKGIFKEDINGEELLANMGESWKYGAITAGILQTPSAIFNSINSENLNNGKPVSIEDIKDYKKAAKDFAEGNPDLEQLLLNCFENKIETHTCCAGHYGQDGHSPNVPYISFVVKPENELYLNFLLKKLKDKNYECVKFLHGDTGENRFTFYDNVSFDKKQVTPMFRDINDALKSINKNESDILSQDLQIFNKINETFINDSKTLGKSFVFWEYEKLENGYKYALNTNNEYYKEIASYFFTELKKSYYELKVPTREIAIQKLTEFYNAIQNGISEKINLDIQQVENNNISLSTEATSLPNSSISSSENNATRVQEDTTLKSAIENTEKENTPEIKILRSDRKVIVSSSILEKIKYFIEKDNVYSQFLKDKLTNEMPLGTFNEVMEKIIHKGKIIAKYIPSEKNDIQYNTDFLSSLSEKYNELLSKEKSYLNLSDTSISELLNVIYRMDNEIGNYYLMRDLIVAKNDISENLKYFASDTEIYQFNEEYEKAIQNKDVKKMNEMLNNVQDAILKEWENYLLNINSMDDNHFAFIGHTTTFTKFEGEFFTRYVSGSLFTQDLTDTYKDGYGFILAPKKIVGASSQDMNIKNDALDEGSICFNSVLKKIDHPQRIIDECLKLKEENANKGLVQSVYSEVVIDGFEPVGIFCFTNKDSNTNYEHALQLQKSFPNLDIHNFDVTQSLNHWYLKKIAQNVDLKDCKTILNVTDQLFELRKYKEENSFKISIENLFPNITIDELEDLQFTTSTFLYEIGKNPVENVTFENVGSVLIDNLQTVFQKCETFDDVYNIMNKMNASVGKKVFENFEEFKDAINIIQTDYNLQDVFDENIKNHINSYQDLFDYTLKTVKKNDNFDVAQEMDLEETLELEPIELLEKINLDVQQVENNDTKVQEDTTLKSVIENIEMENTPEIKIKNDNYKKLNSVIDSFSLTLPIFTGQYVEYDASFLKHIVLQKGGYEEFSALENTNAKLNVYICLESLQKKLEAENVSIPDGLANLFSKCHEDFKAIVNQGDKYFSQFSSYGINQNAVRRTLYTDLGKTKKLIKKVQKIKPELSEKEAIKFLRGIDYKGVCDYAAVLNELVYLFENYSELIENRFGYPLYEEKNGVKKWNDAELLTDFYTFWNQNNKFILKKEDSSQKLKIGTDANKFQMANSSGFINDYAINKFLESFGIKMSKEIKHKEIINTYDEVYNGKNVNVNVHELKSKIAYRLMQGSFLIMDVYPPADRPITFRSINFHKEDVSAINLMERIKNVRISDDGHSIVITGLNDNGIIVSSWGGKYEIRWSELQNNAFIIRELKY